MANNFTLVISEGPDGLLTLPAHLCSALALTSGETLVARLEEGRLILESRATITARIKQRFAHARGGESVVDELLRERHAAAKDE